MNSFSWRINLLVLLWLIISPSLALTQIQDILYTEEFSQGIAHDWWKVSTDSYTTWQSSSQLSLRGLEREALFIYNQANQNNDLAVLTTSAYDVSGTQGDLFVAFDLSTQLFPHNGQFSIEVWNGGSWEPFFSESRSYSGQVYIEIGPYRGADLTFKFVYQSQGRYEEFVSIDNFSIISRKNPFKQEVFESPHTAQNLLSNSFLYKKSEGHYALVISSSQETYASFSLHNLAGEVLREGRTKLSNGQNQIPVYTHNLPLGIYFVNLSSGGEKIIQKLATY